MPKEAARKKTSAKLACPDCGQTKIETSRQKHTFTYGAGSAGDKITAVVPFRHCHGCGLRFLDHEGEEAMHEAVCRHLGVMTPAEIKKLRQSHGLSRKEFAHLTRLGEATIARWERGALIQNEANDHFLFLLRFPENIHKLEQKEKNDLGGVQMKLDLTGLIRIENTNGWPVAVISKKKLASILLGPPEEWIESGEELEREVARICGWDDALFEGHWEDKDGDSWFLIKISEEMEKSKVIGDSKNDVVIAKGKDGKPFTGFVPGKDSAAIHACLSPLPKSLCKKVWKGRPGLPCSFEHGKPISLAQIENATGASRSRIVGHNRFWEGQGIYLKKNDGWILNPKAKFPREWKEI